MNAGRYVRVREIGRGGMGSVWLGEDTVLGREVAMKRVGVVPGGSVPDLVRAEREARLAASLSHPHVVAVFDLVAEGDEHWLVMEHVDGESLAALVRRRGPLAADEAADLLAQVADALAAAHDHGIVHRDVKPSNVLVTADGHAKLTDFGIARAEADASLTQTGLVTGSPAYLSPEVASGSSATPASDVWALGASLYHVLSGRPPYDVGDNVLGALYQIVHEEPPRLDDAGWLAPLLERTMATDPADRWSAARVRDFLRAGPDDAVTATEPAMVPTRVAPTTDAAPHSARPAPSEHTAAFPPVGAGPSGATSGPGRGAPAWAWALVALAVAALVVLGFWLGVRDDPEPTAGDSASPSPDATSQTASPTPSPTEASSATMPPPTSPSGPDPQAMEAFVSGYLATVTDDPRATWQQLTPEFQEESGGFGQYNGFWRTIESAEVLDVAADPEQLTVSYTVRYTLKNGGETTDSVTLRLEPDEDGFQVAGES